MKSFIKKEIIDWMKIALLTFMLGTGVSTLLAWVGPPGIPNIENNCPSGATGCDKPVHIGSYGQIKDGGLILGESLSTDSLGFAVAGGKAGIGTTEPTQMLDVVGYSKSRTGFCINDSCITSFSWATGGDNVVELPSGTVLPFNLSSCPSGWSPFTDGAGRVILGVGNSNTGSGSTASTNHTLGQKGGQEAIVQDESQVAVHSHSFNGGGSSGWLRPIGVPSINSCQQGSNNCSGGNFKNAYNNQGTVWLQPIGSDSPLPMNIMDPYVTLLYCSKN
ncbi:MAG: hypothetical protein U0522_00795 [Candidatus Paceibacterota bacterium]